MDKRIGYSLWTEKYRPITMKEISLPKSTKTYFSKMITEKEIPNLILYSITPGTGKSSLAKCLINDIGCDNIIINASLENGIDVLRDKIVSFASCATFEENTKKIVLLDEVEGLSEAFQRALRGAVEEFQDLCRFMVTCNSIAQIQEPIMNRFHLVNFGEIYSKSKEEMFPKIEKRITGILKVEKVEFDSSIIVPLIEKHYPSIRKMLSVCQNYYKEHGIIDSGVLKAVEITDEIIGLINSNKFSKAREFIINSNINYSEWYSFFYKKLIPTFDKDKQAEAVITLAQYAYQSERAIDKELQMAAALFELMNLRNR
jgi:DNA polymerase III delta prime subunit